MDYFTKTIILHQIEKGFSDTYRPFSTICRLEYDAGIYKCYLTFNNFIQNDSGKLFFLLCDSKNQPHFFYINNNQLNDTLTFPSTPSIEKSLSAGIFFVENNIPLLIAFCKVGSGIELSEMKKLLYDKYIKNPVKLNLIEDKKDDVLEDNFTGIDESIFNKDENVYKAYNDEAVATENYYNDNDELKKQLEFIERFENDISENEDKQVNSREQDGKIQDEENFGFCADEKCAERVAEYSEQSPFYKTVKDEVENLFNKFPIEEEIKKIIPNSKFIKINYSDTKYYVVGVVYENQKEKYICYGVPDNNSKTPPKELKGYCRFVPLSPIGISEEGYWMMFQDAITGDCIKF